MALWCVALHTTDCDKHTNANQRTYDLNVKLQTRVFSTTVAKCVALHRTDCYYIDTNKITKANTNTNTNTNTITNTNASTNTNERT